MSTMTAQEQWQALKPKSKATVLSLIENKVATTGWYLRKDAPPPRVPASNPVFCYEWSYGESGESPVLCVWHSEIRVEGERLVYRENAKQLAQALDAEAASGQTRDKRRQATRQQAPRARKVDERIKAAYQSVLPVWFIINDGFRRDVKKDSEATSSVVDKRCIDIEPWYVHQYDQNTGECLLVRAINPADLTSSAEEKNDEKRSAEEERVWQMRAIEIRRGQPKFRKDLLRAWRSTCLVTGCHVIDLLEAAHITPHAEEVNYACSNGLLLRADIHTLYDLCLLSVDEHLRVHLSPRMKDTEYWLYNGKDCRAKMPDKFADAPLSDALQMRHQVFLKKWHDNSTS